MGATKNLSSATFFSLEIVGAETLNFEQVDDNLGEKFWNVFTISILIDCRVACGGRREFGNINFEIMVILN